LIENTFISFYLAENKIHVFCDAVRAIGEPAFVRFRLNSDGTSMIMEPYDKKEFQSMRVPRAVYNKTGKMEFRSVGFCRLLSSRFGWERTYSYRIPGKVLPKQGLVLFELTCAIQFKVADGGEVDGKRS
jgi:hypothetical protein